MSQTATIPASGGDHPRWRWTRETFARMGERGIFGPEDRVELIEGGVIALSLPNPLHSGTVNPATDSPSYWILNLRDQQLEVCRDPADGQYLSRRIYRPAESVAPLAAPPQALVSVSALLGL